MKTLLLFLTLLLPALGQAQIYGLGQVGYARLNKEEPASKRVFPTGMTFGLGIGVRRDFFELEASYQKFSGSGDINHDKVDNSLIHKQSSFILALNFYLSKKFYARLGYGFYKVDQSLDKKVSDASTEGARKTYGIKENVMTDGFVYGAGYVIYDSSSMAIYTQIENQNMSSLGASSLSGVLGIKVYGY